jgi:hypothetical protein
MSAPSAIPFTSIFDSLIYDDNLTSGGPTDKGTLEVIKKSRIPNVRAATEIFSRLINADYRSSLNRAAVQAMFDGAPPYSESAQRQQGQGYLSNFSSGAAKQALDSAMAAYVDMLFSVEHLMRIRTNWGSEDERAEWEAIISEEWTRMMREWKLFKFNFLNLCNFFIQHGVGLAYFPDDKNWQYRTSGLGDFYVPRMTFTAEDELEVACCARDYLPHQLNAMISGKYTDPHWNKEQVQKAIEDALLNRSYAGAGPDTINLQPELIQAELKNNDLCLSYGTNTYIRTIHFWVKEVDGSVTHLISLRSGTNSDFLYKRMNRFKSMDEAFTFFTYGIGDNGYIHSVRGMGWKIFNKVQMIDRLENRAADSALLAASILLKPQTENDMQETAMTYIGQCAYLNPNVDVVPYEFPNIGQNVMPMLAEMRSLLQNDIGQYANPALASDSTERTKFEWRAKLAESAKVSSTGQLLFYDPIQRLWRNVLRKQLRKDYRADEPGGKEVWEWLKRCMKRGVPIEALREIDPDRSTVVRSLGAGSEAMRVMMYDEMMQTANGLDPVGRQNFMRDWWAMRVGYDQVDRYIPKASVKREPDQTKTALLENKLFEQGSTEIPVLPNEMHSVHAPIHMGMIEQLIAAIEQDENLAPQLFGPLYEAVNHNVAHIEFLSQDPFYQKEAAELRKALQKSNEILHNTGKKLQMMEERAALEAQEQGGQPPVPAIDPKQMLEIEKNRQELEQSEARFQQDMRHREEKFRQEQAIRDQTAAAKMLMP